MGIQFAVHTYGHHEAMFYVLNGIKMIMDSGFAMLLINTMAIISTGYYSISGWVRANDGLVGHYFLKTVGMLLLVTSLLLPKADILVVDRINGKKELVTNLPYAFVLPFGMLEAVGAGITSIFEQAFSTVSSTPYKDYGLIFGSRLVQESRNWRFSNPELIRNMDKYIERCVVVDAEIGYRFTIEDIARSNDIFGFMTQKAGTFRLVDFMVNQKPSRLNCKQATAQLKHYFKSERDFLNFKYKGTDYSIAGSRGVPVNINAQANTMLMKNLEVAYGSTLGVNGSASDIITQLMFINSLYDYANNADTYGYTRADQLQKSNWQISGELAKEYLPLLLNIMKALIYASFIFMVPLMILAGGMQRYLKYCAVVFSLQIWPALNSILNLFIELYSKTKGTNITGGNLSIVSFNSGHDAIDTIVLVASGLQLSIPFLSYAIVQGGVASFVHLASNIQGASQNAASVAAGEVTTGNRSFDNINQDNMSLANKSGFKTDFNQSHQEGAMQVQRADGSILKSFADGSNAITSGAGINLSSGSRGLFMENAKQSSLSEGYQGSLMSMQGMEQHYNQSKTAAISSTTDRVSHLAQKQAAGETLNFDTSTEEGKAMQQAVNNTVALHDKEDYSWGQAASAGVSAYVEGKAGLGVSVGAKADAGVSVDNSSRQSLDKDTGVSRENATNQHMNTLIKAASSQGYSKDDSIDESLANNTRASYEQMQSYGQSLSQKREEVETYNMAIQSVANKGATDRTDMTHAVENQVMKEYGVSREQAHTMVETGDSRANQVWNNMVQDATSKELQQVRASRQLVDNNAAQNSHNFHNEHSGKVNNQGQIELQQKAANEGLNANIMKAKIQGSHDTISTKKEDMTQNDTNQIKSVEHHNTTLERGMNNKVDQYEKDRIGQGKVAQGISTITDNIPFTNLGRIGGPNSTQKAQEYLKGESKAPQIPNVKTPKNSGEK
jgi:conjugal transfer mating pair stabilization protein TraG